MTGRLWYLLLGSTATNGQRGKLTGIEIDVERWRVTGVIVSTGLLRRQERRFPVGMVRNADAEGVHLMIGRGQSAPVSAAVRLLTEDTPVVDQQRNRLGAVAGARVNVLGHLLTHLLFQSSAIGAHPRLLPVQQVAGFEGETIVAAISAEDGEQLSTYLPDDQIRREVIYTLYHSPSVSDADFKGITVAVEHGVVTLSGNVRSGAIKRTVEAEVRGLPFVLSLRNELIDDIELEEVIARTLAEHSITRDARLVVHSRCGDVILRGFAPLEAAVEEAKQLTASIQGVRTVEALIATGRSSNSASPPERLHSVQGLGEYRIETPPFSTVLH